ncbi:glycosyltransferase [Microbacterium sp. T2.11-28]|uniref:glycosyltransferase n=1 Tax=Microbacterium sp. T2.11-28 TaxID=3041169 RepID=UPI002477666C|nr:glycosyltransferase [Microbacterium sp. T2.11-28]CAI9390960.1 Alpha-monoglucosyldiacylglycerol synthase [Microbacterium sp. T2.11-28]
MTESASPADDPQPARSPLTIVMAADTFAPDVNGAARFAERLSAGLAARGHTVHVVTPSVTHSQHGTFTERIEGQDLTVHRLPGWRWYPHDWLRFALPWMSKHYARRVLSEVKPDVVHSQSHIVIGRGLTRIARQRGIPVIATNHVMAENIIDFTTLPPLLDKVALKLAWDDAERTFKMSQAVTTPTRRAAEFLESTIDIQNVIAISCGIDKRNYTPDFTPRPHRRVLFVGRLTTEKHVEVTLEAVAKLAPELPEITFDIVGGGDQRRNLEQTAQRLGIADRVTFHGRVDEEQLRASYSKADVFAIASIAELQSIATMEAMASGLPVVAANAVALPHLVQDGVNGYLFEPGDVDDLADKLRRVLTAAPDEYLRMQQASLEGVNVHDIEKTLDTFEKLYRGEPL